MSKDPARTFMRNEKKRGGKQSKKSKDDTEGEFIEEPKLDDVPTLPGVDARKKINWEEATKEVYFYVYFFCLQDAVFRCYG